MPSQVRQVTASRIGFLIVLTLVFALAGLAALDFRAASRPLPLLVAGAGVVFGSVLALRETRALLRAKPVTADTDGAPERAVDSAALASAGLVPSLRFWAWIVAYVLMTAAIGFYIASAVFLVSFLKLRGGTSLAWAVPGAAIAVGTLWFLEATYGINIPPPIWAG